MRKRSPSEADVVLVRAGSGTIHLGIPLGRGADTMCCEMISSPVLRTLAGDDADRYLTPQRTRYLCTDCVEVSEKPWATICTITGWS